MCMIVVKLLTCVFGEAKFSGEAGLGIGKVKCGPGKSQIVRRCKGGHGIRRPSSESLRKRR